MYKIEFIVTKAEGFEKGKRRKGWEVGKEGVLSIEEYRAEFERDKWYYDIKGDNWVVRCFDVESVGYGEVDK